MANWYKNSMANWYAFSMANWYKMRWVIKSKKSSNFIFHGKPVRFFHGEPVHCFRRIRTGSHEVAERSAMLYSFLGTCKLNSINPIIWLQDILRRISNHPINKIEDLLPAELESNCIAFYFELI